MDIGTQAPAKAILFGEHYAVYGATGIVAAIEPTNRMQINIGRGIGELEYLTTKKECGVRVNAKECVKTGKKYGAGGTAKNCDKMRHPIAALYCHYVSEHPQIRNMRVCAKVERAWETKGVGNSASLSACFAYGVRKAIGAPLGAKDLFEDVQIAEAAAHKIPSGIDSAAACYGGVLEYRRIFDSRPSIKKTKAAVPKGESFLLIDTCKKGAVRANTKDMIRKFARTNYVRGAPQDLGLEVRERICYEYEEIFYRAQHALKNSDSHELAQAMNENHALLRKSGVSSKSIELAIKTAMTQGAMGAKITGAGGNGGAIIAFCQEEAKEPIVSALKKKGFFTYEFAISKKGVSEI